MSLPMARGRTTGTASQRVTYGVNATHDPNTQPKPVNVLDRFTVRSGISA
jgi:hypothetical protein